MRAGDLDEAHHEGGCFVLHRCGRIVINRWTASPRADAFGEIIGWLALQKRVAGGELAYIEIVPGGISIPGPAEITEAIRHASRLRFMRGPHVLICEGDEIMAAIVRGVARSIAFAVNDILTTASSIDDALAICARYTREDVAAARRAFVASGLIASAA